MSWKTLWKRLTGGEQSADPPSAQAPEAPQPAPVPAAPSAGSAPAFTAGPAVSGELLRVLVVEDDFVNQKVILGMLRKLGFTPDLAINGQEAVEMLRDQDYDLVLMDCHMPVLDGISATRQIREEEQPERHVHIVALTAYTTDNAEARCREAGMDDFLSKPISIAVLTNLFERWGPALEQQRAAS
jgi:CheY-like chemotaxis protein